MTTGRLDFIAYALLPCILLMHLTKAIPFLPSLPNAIYYGGFISVFVWLVLRGGLTISYRYFLFLLAALISICVNDISPFFNVWFRFGAFLSLILAVGPLVTSPFLTAWRRLAFTYALVLIRWIVLLSFWGWLFRLNFVHGYSGFRGVTNQSMLLGPLSGISLIYCLYRFYLLPEPVSRYKEIVMAVLSVIVMLLAGSRSALASSMLAVGFFYTRVYRHQVTRLWRIIFTGLCLAVLTSAIWWPYTERLREKMTSSKKSGSLTGSRDNLWDDRMREFKAFPVFGVGFATVNMEYIETDKKVNKETGTVEPGSGWLFLLSSMGIVGFLSFFIPYTHTLYLLFRRESIGLNGYFLGALLFMFFFHLYFEGYLISAGAYFCFFLWLLLSECERIKNKIN